MKLRNLFVLGLAVFILAFALFFVLSRHHHAQRFVSIGTWQHMVSPGELSQAHAFLENNCAACHAPTKSVPAQNCIACHANNQALLQRQPTAFHANVQNCTVCHLEHNGRLTRPSEMNHAALIKLSLTNMSRGNSGADRQVPQMEQSLSALPNPHLTRDEALLNCATCHDTKDKHQGFFGKDCAQCHATAKWTIAEFRHPSPSSQSCAQCHQAPPSHYMEHFNMVSKKVARQEDAQVAECCGPVQVNQCYRCHQTTSWNDIKGVGWYKHH